MKLPGFRVTRYSADSVQFLPPEKKIHLVGSALLERDNSTLQADTVGYDEKNCALTAEGSPQMFDAQGVVVGHGMRYDACNHAGIIGKATTDFPGGLGDLVPARQHGDGQRGEPHLRGRRHDHQLRRPGSRIITSMRARSSSCPRR